MKPNKESHVAHKPWLAIPLLLHSVSGVKTCIKERNFQS